MTARAAELLGYASDRGGGDPGLQRGAATLVSGLSHAEGARKGPTRGGNEGMSDLEHPHDDRTNRSPPRTSPFRGAQFGGEHVRQCNGRILR